MSSSIISAIKKLRELLTREEKLQWLKIAGFALCTSGLEIITASVIVVFAQVLTNPVVGIDYFRKVGIIADIPANMTVFYLALLCGVVYLVKNIIAATEIFYQNITIQRMCYNFKNKLLQRYADADYSFYLTRNSSYGMTVLTGDASSAFLSGMVPLASVLSEIIVFCCLVGLIVAMDLKLAMTIFLIGGILSFVISKWIFPLFYSWGKRLQDASLLAHQHLLQFFHSFKEIVLLGKKATAVSEYKKFSLEQSKLNAVKTASNALPRITIEVLFVGCFVVAIAVMCLDNDSPQQMLGVLGGYLYVGFRLMPGLNRIIMQLNSFKAVIPNIERVHQEYQIVASKDEELDIAEFHFKDQLALQNVSFSYINTARDVLQNINLVIKKGECIGIIGATGSGKSTLVDVLLGLLKPHAGSVLVDKKFSVNSKQWRAHIGYVPQEDLLLEELTVFENLNYN
ncbi:MAG: ABC transporter ATP-binding protein, partial [Thiotrichales bacterium]